MAKTGKPTGASGDLASTLRFLFSLRDYAAFVESRGDAARPRPPSSRKLMRAGER